MSWTNKQVIGLILVAAVGGYVLGRLSINLRIGLRGEETFVDGASSDFELEEPGPAAEDSERVPVAHAPFLGPASAKVTLIEFSDFQCPFCQRAGPVIHELMARYEDDLRVVFVNLPLPMHADAVPAARAALAAHQQGAFWDYHDILFANQRALDRDSLLAYAEDLDLDIEAFERALDDESIADRVDADAALARSLGINGTPTFMVNGVEVIGVQDAATFGRVIEAEIEAADGLLDEGASIRQVYRRRIDENLGSERDGGAAAPAPTDRAARPALERAEVIATPSSPPATNGGPPRLAEGEASLMVFADVSDSAYGALGQALERLMDAYGDRLDVRFESFVDPEDETAVQVAAALRVASEQGRFRDYHRLLLRSDGPVSAEALEAWAEEAGLDLTTFRSELQAEDNAARARAQREEAQQNGIIVAPTVRVGGAQMVGAVPFDDLRVAVNEAMERREPSE